MSEWRELARGNTTLASGFDNLAFKAVWLNSPSSYTISVIYFFFKKYIGNKNYIISVNWLIVFGMNPK